MAPFAKNLLEEFTPDQIKQDRMRDESIYVMAQSSGWAEAKKIIDLWLEQLNDLNIDTKDTVETVGYKYLAAQTAKQYLLMLKGYVDGTKEALDGERTEE